MTSFPNKDRLTNLTQVESVELRSHDELPEVRQANLVRQQHGADLTIMPTLFPVSTIKALIWPCRLAQRGQVVGLMGESSLDHGTLLLGPLQDAAATPRRTAMVW